MKKADLILELNRHEGTSESSQSKYIYDRLPENFKVKFAEIRNKALNKYRREWLSKFQFRNNDFKVVSISEVPQDVLDSVFQKFVNQIGGIETIVYNASFEIFKPLNDLTGHNEFEISPKCLNALSKDTLEEIYNEIQENIKKYIANIYSILGRIESLTSTRCEYILEEYEDRHYIIYPWRENIYIGVIGDVLNCNIYHGLMDCELNRTPEDYKKELEIRHLADSSISKYYEKVGKCDF